MAVSFRNVDVPAAVEQWPYEAIVATVERGTIGDWAVLTRAIAVDPWGEVARQVEEYLGYADDAPAAALLRRRIARARADADADDRRAVASRVRAAVTASGLTITRFARRIGTSRSRLSTYCNGSVTPSAAMLLRIERTGSRPR